jgi:membrane-associated protein
MTELGFFAHYIDMEIIRLFLDVILNLNQYLSIWTDQYGVWIYLIVFLIVFCETGLVVTPFLPGDSLLFALGAIAAMENSALNIYYLGGLLLLAALLGDNVNYFVGRNVGARLFVNPKSRFLNPQNLNKTEAFYKKWGGLAVIIARFAPFFRTFVPFVAGLGKMNYRKYLMFSFVGAILWIQLFLWAGYIFGDLPIVKRNFHIVIVAVIVLSLMPMIVAFMKSKLSTKN